MANKQTLKLKTAHEEWGEPDDDVGRHLICPNCGNCITCDDCHCEMRQEWIKRGLIKDGK